MIRYLPYNAISEHSRAKMDPTNLYRSRFPITGRGACARHRCDPHQTQRGKMSARPGKALLAPCLESRHDQPQRRSLRAIWHPHARLSAHRTNPDVAVASVISHRKRGA